MPSLTALLALVVHCQGLDNGFSRPALGWSSWYAAPSGSQVTEDFVKSSATALIDSGLASKGYVYINVDEGWLKGRHPGNNTIFEDLEKFPSGMAELGSWIRSLPTSPGSEDRMKYGLYSCRGTCQCGTRYYGATGSHGFEAQDTMWMVEAGAQWLKIDSCCGSQDHATAFSDYSKFRDAMNKTGKQVWFNLCGWHDWYAPPDPSIGYAGGESLGNSWRIYADGGSFQAITGALNTMARLGNYSKPGAYSDPDNILGPHGTVGRVTETQARTQMVMWSIFPTQLILGEDVTKMSDEFVETVGNEELIAINQDYPFVSAAKRIMGGDLTYPCNSGGSGALAEVHAQKCIDGSAQQQFYFNATDSTLRPASYPHAFVATTLCDFAHDGNIISVFPDGKGGTTCGGAKFVHNQTDSTIRGAAGKCVDEYEFTTPRVDLWSCQPGARNEAWRWTPSSAHAQSVLPSGSLTNMQSGFCLTVTPLSPAQDCTNVWSRPLSNGDVAVAMVNHGANSTITCGVDCFAAAGLSGARTIAVRDLIAHSDLPTLNPPFNFSVMVNGDGGAAAFRLTPSN